MGFLITALHIVDKAFKGRGIGARKLALILDFQNFIRAVQKLLKKSVRRFCKGLVQGKIVFFRNGAYEIDHDLGVIFQPEKLDGPLFNGQAFVWNQQVRVNFLVETESVALGTHPKGVVEGKGPGLQRIHGNAAVWTGQLFAEKLLFAADHITDHQAVCQMQGCLDGVGQAFGHVFLALKAVNHHLNAVLFIFFQLDVFTGFSGLAVYDQTDIALLFQMVQQLFMLPLLTAHHRRQNLKPGAGLQSLNGVHNLVHTLRLNNLAAFWAVGNANTGIKQTEIVIYFRHCPNSRTGVPVGGFLVNGNGR